MTISNLIFNKNIIINYIIILVFVCILLVSYKLKKKLVNIFDIFFLIVKKA